MMEHITLEFVGEFIAFLVALVGGLGYLNKTLKAWLTKLMKEEFDQINTRLDRVDLEACKNFLVRTIPDIEDGEINETEKERFYEQYEHYLQVGGNTYIKHKVEVLQKEGKI